MRRRDTVSSASRGTDALLHSLRDKAVQVQAFAQANHSTIFRANGFWSAIEQFVDGHHKAA